MSTPTVIDVRDISKQYRLGQVGTGTLSHDLSRWWHRIRGKEDPFLKIGETNDRSTKSTNPYVWALKDVSFEVPQGEVLGIIGKNGAGKSTLLKILSRVTTPTTGRIHMKGRLASLLEVGTGFHPEMTGRENIYMNGTIMGMTRQEVRSKLEEIIEFAGVAKYVDTPVKRYSSGMTVRLGFAIAAHLEPEILVVDEVLAVGDAEFQKKAIGKMQDVSKGQGRTVLFVSHNMASIQNLCNSGILLQHGKVELISNNIRHVIDEYLNQLKEQETTPIAKRKDRQGVGVIQFTDFSVANQDGTQISVITTGQNISFILTCDVHGNDTLNDVSVAISFRRSDGFMVSLVSSDYYLKTFKNVKGQAIFVCRINDFPFSAGIYKANIMVKDKGVIQDWIVDASIIEVENGDFYGTGQINPSSHPGVLLKHQWSKG